MRDRGGTNPWALAMVVAMASAHVEERREEHHDVHEESLSCGQRQGHKGGATVMQGSARSTLLERTRTVFAAHQSAWV